MLFPGFLENVWPQQDDTHPSYPQQPVQERGEESIGVPYDGAKEVTANPGGRDGGFFQWMDEQVGAVAALLDREEQIVDAAVGQRGYKIVRKEYRVGEKRGVVGKGSFGVVYKAMKNDRAFGIKKIEGATQKQGLLIKEINILKMFNHPSCVNYVETIEDASNDTKYIIMEFVAGGDLLRRIVKAPHDMNEALIRALMFHISCALAFAHQQGIVHRDMKPENVLLTETGFPKIADFGLSKHLYADQNNTKAGTPAYAAPEVMTGKYGFPVDVFSTGKILQDMMAKDYVVEWMFNRLPPGERPNYTKQWKGGVGKPQFTADLTNLMKNMTRDSASSRPTFYQVCREIESMGQRHRLPHPFWGPEYLSRQIRAQGPPNYAYKTAKCPYGIGEKVSVDITGMGWVNGVVDHVGERLQPGAACIKYQRNGKEEVVLIPPNQIKTRIRKQGAAGGRAAPSGGNQNCCVIC